MKFSELPEGTKFYDMDSRPVAVLPNATHVAFTAGEGDAESRPFPNGNRSSWSDMGDLLSREEFASWLEKGINRFDACYPGPDSTLAGLVAQITPDNRHALAVDHDVLVGGEVPAAERWLAENGEALASSNAYVEEPGLPLAHQEPDAKA